MVEEPRKDGDTNSWFSITILFILIIALLPFAMDYFVDLAGVIGAAKLSSAFLAYRWLSDVIGYTAVYLFMLFYMKTTFEPLSTYGYVWKKDYFWWAVYIGIASGIAMFFVDWTHGLGSLQVAAFSLSALIGYLLSWVILPALVEETLFRGVIQRSYQKRLRSEFTSQKIHIAVFLAVAFELLFHLAFPAYFGAANGTFWESIVTTLPQLIYVAVFGFIGGVLYQRTGSLVAPITIHALGNFVELLLIWGFR